MTTLELLHETKNCLESLIAPTGSIIDRAVTTKENTFALAGEALGYVRAAISQEQDTAVEADIPEGAPDQEV